MKEKNVDLDVTKAPYKLADDLLEAYKQAKRSGYVVARRRNLIDAWKKYCELRRLPCVIVKPRRQHATVSMDIVLCDFVLDEKHMDIISEMMHENSDPESDVTVGLDYCSSNYVYFDQAEFVASETLKIAKKAKKGIRRRVTPQGRKKIGRKTRKNFSREIANTRSRKIG
jgi:hypothetical protein